MTIDLQSRVTDPALGRFGGTPDEFAPELKEAAVGKWYEQGLMTWPLAPAVPY